MAQWLTIPTSNRGVSGLIPGLAQWVKDPASSRVVGQVADTARIPHCCGCGVGRRGGYSSDLTPSLGPSICGGCGSKKDKRQKKKKNLELCHFQPPPPPLPSQVSSGFL